MDMDIDQQQQVRYDRQIRLWGDEGQQSIRQARVCVFGSTALAAETLKSLVLAGIGSFHIIDKALVDHGDLGQNFFVEPAALGHYRGECLVKLLTELNPSVHGQHHAVMFSEFKRQDFQMLVQFSVVIGTNLSASEALQLDQFLFQHGVPFIWTRICGMIGHLRLSFREHHIWNTHSENDAYDLRLDHPFPELLSLANQTDLNAMTHEQHSHTPYVLLYFKAIDEWRKRKKSAEDAAHLYALATEVMAKRRCMLTSRRYNNRTTATTATAASDDSGGDADESMVESDTESDDDAGGTTTTATEEEEEEEEGDNDDVSRMSTSDPIDVQQQQSHKTTVETGSFNAMDEGSGDSVASSPKMMR